MTLRILIFALTLAAIHAESPIAQPDPALAYQTARANALEAENAVLRRVNEQNQVEIQVLQMRAQATQEVTKLQAAQQSAQHALDAARDALKKACGDKWDEKTSACAK